MKISKELKVGIVVIVAIALFIFGFQFLKGKNIFNKQTTLFSVYDKIDGLIEANPLQVNGFKVGQVSKIELLRVGDTSYKVKVSFILTEDVKIPKNSKARIISADLLGTKAVQIIFNQEETEYVKDGDELIPDTDKSLQENVSAEIAPLKKKMEGLIGSIDSVMTVVKEVMNADVRNNLIASFESIKNTIKTLESTTYKVDTLVSSEQARLANIINKVNSIAANIERNNDKITNIINNFSSLSDTLAKSKIKETIENTNKALAQANGIIADINAGKGSVGKLIKNDSLYNNLNKSAADLDKLMNDLRINPERYMHFSIFGRKPK